MNNSGNLKIIAIVVGAMLTVAIPAAAVIYAYGGKSQRIDEIVKDVEKLEPLCIANKEDIISMKIYIAQILKTQGEMIKAEEQNQKAVLAAIRGIKNVP